MYPSNRKNLNKKAGKKIFKLKLLFVLFIFSQPFLASAQDAMTFTITPPLIKNNVSPGEDWGSAVRVVNNNSQEMEVYAKVMDFKGGGEAGNVQLLKEHELEGGENFLLSKWILIDPGPYKIPAFGSKDIPFLVRVPEDAEPGGHYAAILLGNQPPKENSEGSVLRVSSMIGSLLFLRAQGDIQERGWIREFSTAKKYFSEPDIDFSIKFENAGNVHIRPQGEIKITTMFGQAKEAIKINHDSEFNYVLPGDIRKWEFKWEDKKNFFEMGRYKAELILAYGEQARETSTQTIYFWIIYLKPLLIALASFILFILLLVLFIRSYVRRALKRTQDQIKAFQAPAEEAVEAFEAKKAVGEEGFVKKRRPIQNDGEPVDKINKTGKKVKKFKKVSGPVDLRDKQKRF
jgi:hypothetical protein